MSNIFKVTHHYLIDKTKNDFCIETELSPEEAGDALATIQFCYEKYVDDCNDFDFRLMIPILVDFFPIKIVEGIAETIDYSETLDLYPIREGRCGPRYLELMEQPIVKNKEFLAEILKLR